MRNIIAIGNQVYIVNSTDESDYNIEKTTRCPECKTVVKYNPADICLTRIYNATKYTAISLKSVRAKLIRKKLISQMNQKRKHCFDCLED